MVDMVAGKSFGFDVEEELILADGAEGNGIQVEEGGRDFEGRDGIDGGPGGGERVGIEVARREEIGAVIWVVAVGEMANEVVEERGVEEGVVGVEGGGGVHFFEEVAVAVGAEKGGGGGRGWGEGDAHVALVAPVGAAVDGGGGGGGSGSGGGRHDVSREGTVV